LFVSLFRFGIANIGALFNFAIYILK